MQVTVTFVSLRLAYAVRKNAARAMVQGDMRLAAQRQRAYMQLIGGIPCP